MTLQRQFAFWAVTLLLLILSLWYLQDILLPFIAGFVLAYFLDPIADRLERLGLPRVVATALIILSAILLLIAVALLIIPVMVNQITALATNFPTLVDQITSTANQWMPQQVKDFMNAQGTDMQGTVTSFAGRAALWAAGLFSSLWSGGKALINVISLLIITPIVAFYLLADWDHIVAKIDGWVPRDHLASIRAIAHDVDTSMSGYIRGQGTVCLLLGLFYAIGFWLVGLKSGFAIGFASGLLSFIPYVGALLGGATALGVGILQFWPNEITLLWVIAVLIIGQFIEGNFLSPKLVGGSIGLHPVWMMFALLAFSYVFGFLGLLLAVPLAATTAVFVRHGLARYLRSKIYIGHAPLPHDKTPTTSS